MSAKNLAVIVLSCDRFASLWPLFFKRLDMHFPQDIGKIYLLSNHFDFTSDGLHLVNVIKIGQDVSWSDNLKCLLSLIREQNVLLLMDDGPLCKNLSREVLKDYYESFLAHKMNYLNLKGSPAPDINLGVKFGELLPSVDYRAAVAPSFWKTAVLIDLLEAKETAWQFEVFGSKRSSSYSGFFSTTQKVLELDHIVIRGKIDRSVYKKLKDNDEHIGLDFPVMTVFEYYKEAFNREKSKFLRAYIPVSMLFFLRKLKYRS